MKVVVIGGTGTVGSLVVNELIARGVRVRALVRSNEAVAKLPREVEPAIGDLLEPVSVAAALRGADKVYLLNAVVPDELTQGLIAFGLADELRLKHIVYHSVFHAERFPEVPHFASKIAIENAIKMLDMPYTIIRPNYFFQNDLGLKGMLFEGVYPVPLGTPGVSAVDARDIAEAAAIALTGSGHLGKTYNLNGPDPISGPKAAAIWSEALGRQVGYAGEDMNAYEAQMRGRVPSWAAFDLRMMFQRYLERGFVADEGDVVAVTRLLGHPPRRYVDFAREAARRWQP